MTEFNAQTLAAVGRELAATLNEARVALEASAERPGDLEPLQKVHDLAAVTHGVLDVVGVHGGALLAREIHAVASYLVGRGAAAPAQPEALDALMRAVVQLPAYVERVLGGGRDLAIVLLPLMNDLRAVRGAPLMSEGAALGLSLACNRDPPPRRAVAGEPPLSVTHWARKLRTLFQLALLGWLKDENPAHNLKTLSDVSRKLESVATTRAAWHLWWVTAAVFEAIREHGLAAAPALKRLLGQCDRELKRLYELGEATYACEPPVELLNNLLYALARATSTGKRVTAVKQAFRLSELLPMEDVLQQERDSLSAPSVKLMQTVAAAIKEDLARVKDALDIFTRKGGQPEELAPQIELLKKIGDTLAVLGLGALRDRVHGELARLSDIATRRLPPQQDSLVGIAAALISLEDTLDESLLALILPQPKPAAGAYAIEPEFRSVAEAVLREALVNLARMKDAISQVLQPGGDAAGIDSIPQLARGIASALLILGRHRAVSAVDRLGATIVRALGRIGEVPPAETVQRLADAVVSVECYLETLQGGRYEPMELLEGAEQNLRLLESSLAAEYAAATAERTVVIARPEQAAEATQITVILPAATTPVIARWPQPAEKTEVIARLGQPAEKTEVIARLEQPTERTEVIARLEQPAEKTEVIARLGQPAEKTEVIARLGQSAEWAPAAPPPVDAELLAIFIEEAREEIERIKQLFPLWADNDSDKESLVRVRRSFHTLKGSGRMVGAMRMGEFAWSVEGLLNRLIDGTRTRSAAMLGLLAEAAAALPEIVDELEQHTPVRAPLDAMQARLRALTEGREPVEATAGTASGAQVPAAASTRSSLALEESGAASGSVSFAVQAPPATPAERLVEAAMPPVPATPAETTAETAEMLPPVFPVEPRMEAESSIEVQVESPAAAVVPEPVAVVAEPGPAASDRSLQEIFRKEVESHLEELRRFLRRAWTSPGPHRVSEELYRACHTLRGASRTAESPASIALAEPLHRWVMRLFDHELAFDENGLTALADAVGLFEDILENIDGSARYERLLRSLVARLESYDAEARRLVAESVKLPATADTVVVESLTAAEPLAARAEEVEWFDSASAEATVLMPTPLLPAAEPGMVAAEHATDFIDLGAMSPAEAEPIEVIEITAEGPETEAELPGEAEFVDLDALEQPAPEAGASGFQEVFAPPEMQPPTLADLELPGEHAAEVDITGAFGMHFDSTITVPAEIASEALQAPPPPETGAEPASEPDIAPAAGEPRATEGPGVDTLEIKLSAALLAAAEMQVAEPASIAPTAGPAGSTPTDIDVYELARAAGNERDAAPEPAVAPVAAMVAVPPSPPAEEPDAGESGLDEEFDPDIAAIFCEEATELLETADVSLAALRAERGSRERVVELQRALHTLKGGARMAGIRAMGDLSHEVESLLIQAGAGTAALDGRTCEVLQASLDELSRMRDLVNGGRGVRPARELIDSIRGLGRAAVGTAAVPAAAVEPAPAPVAPSPQAVDAAPVRVMPGPAEEPPLDLYGPIADEPPAPLAEPIAAEVEPAQAAVLPGREAPVERAEMARVDAELLDAMLNNAGEVSIFRARLEQQLSSIEFNLAELGRVVQRFKDQLRKLEIETEAQILHRHVEAAPRRDDFDPLELDRYSSIQQYSRALTETAADVGSVQNLLENQTREAQNLLTQQGRVVTDLQGGLMRTRMVPFQRHVQRLTRVVRQAAADAGKRVDLVVQGATGELDRQVLDRMLPPFEHMLRNSVVHGLETPVERTTAGKSPAGRIDVSLKREGSEVVIVVADDGAGINLRAVREKAVIRGLLGPKQEISDEEAIQLILEPGFSTATRVTQAAGRGVGMDVVASEVKKLGGALQIETWPGRGTRFTIRLPFTLAISQALVVRSGDELYALPLTTVEGVVRIPKSEVVRHLSEEVPTFEYGGQRYRFQHLGLFVGGVASALPEQESAVPVTLVRAGEHSTAIVTDELLGSREIVVKSVGPMVSGIRGISGATILGDGRICIILDIGALVRSEWRTRALRPAEHERADTRVFALVVDDSITVRRVTQRLLERNGMRVMTAKDGLDAVGVLQDNVPDVLLLDVEMPRMDGYEVASHVRNDPRLKHIPIVMVTSRVGEKHRARAIELGIDEYLGKPYQEQQLLEAIEPLVRKRKVKS